MSLELYGSKLPKMSAVPGIAVPVGLILPINSLVPPHQAVNGVPCMMHKVMLKLAPAPGSNEYFTDDALLEGYLLIHQVCWIGLNLGRLSGMTTMRELEAFVKVSAVLPTNPASMPFSFDEWLARLPWQQDF